MDLDALDSIIEQAQQEWERVRQDWLDRRPDPEAPWTEEDERQFDYFNTMHSALGNLLEARRLLEV